PVSESYLAAILRSQGVLPLWRRGRPPRPGEPARDGSEVPAIADIRELSLEAGRTLPTPAAGLFLFLPLLLDGHFSPAVQAAGYPGTQQLPALQAMLSLLAPKLLGKRRVSHVSDLCTDEGAGLFAGLNVLPKTTYATDYSYQTERPMNERLVDELTRRMPLKEPPLCFNLDFHAIPLSRPTGRFGEPLGAQKSPGTARRDGLCRPRGQAARDVLRHHQRGACRGGHPGREICRSLAHTHRALSKPPVVRLAGNDLCQPQRTDPPRGGIYHHPPSWVSHAQADPGIAGSTVASLPSYSGQGKTSLGEVCGSDRDLGRIPGRVAADRLRRPGTRVPNLRADQ